MNTLEICVLDNGIALHRQRTLDSLQKQTDPDFTYHIQDITAFWSETRCTLATEGDYVLFLYGGSVLTDEAVATLKEGISHHHADWFYADEEVLDWQSSDPCLWKKEAPAFSALNFFTDPYDGEAVVFSRTLLQKLQPRYCGPSFTAAIQELTLAAAIHSDGVHLSHPLLQRYPRMPLQKEDISLLSQLALQGHQSRGLPFTAAPRKDAPGVTLLPTPVENSGVSVIVLSETAQAPSAPVDFPYEWLVQPLTEPYHLACFHGAQRAQGDLLCFVSDHATLPDAMSFRRLLSFAAAPQVGMVSPCLRHDDSISYAGVFSTAGQAGVFSTEANAVSLTADRETVFPAKQFWLIRREVLEQLDFTCPYADDLAMQEFALQCRDLGYCNLYAGSVTAHCAEMPASFPAGDFSRMLLRRGAFFFTDPFCPSALKALLRRDALRGVNAYFPDNTMPYDPQRKTMLVLSHELSLTGAPVVLAQAVSILQQEGWQIVLASPEDGVLKRDFLRLGIPVLILGEHENDPHWVPMASSFDLVLVNTIVPFRQIDQLRDASVPVLWWIHDARSGYQDYLRHVLPETVGENIHIYAVSPYADRAVRDFRPLYPTRLLLYGLSDDAPQRLSDPLTRFAGKSVFIHVGTVSKRKGQDIMAQAIRLLPEAVRKNSVFLFVGKCIDPVIYQSITALQQDFPQEVELIDSIPRDRILPMYHYATAVVCSSRDDPLPTFMAETMMMSGVCICSENTGTAPLLQHGVNGYVYHNDDPQQLADCLQECLSCPDSLPLRKAARQLFEQEFSTEVFRKNLLRSVSQCLQDTEV